MPDSEVIREAWTIYNSVILDIFTYQPEARNRARSLIDAAIRADERKRYEALAGFTRHKPDCKKEWAERVAGEGGWPCTCGLERALAALKEEATDA